ncbi:MAG: Crp/Fnr family transcriptional regulator [Erysipelotrichaceae bacterium]|jgi:CRP-like cAMP-binding protein|nr:Crp/Fnr family transcriptional regulator [Bacillota bacterium]NLP22256.1 Crp/Fnr family transcriptional regulator [Erysipelotrichaceae bacterium]
MDNKELVHNLYLAMKKCRFVRTRNYVKGDVIANYIVNRNYVYFILSGSANLIRITRYGEDVLLEKYEEYDFFGELFHNVTLNNEMRVVARNKCTIFSFDFDIIRNDDKYLSILKLILEITTNRIKKMNTHTEILSGKTTRDKLLIFFNISVRNKFNKVIELDMTYTELASYLNVDRSSMMRELSQLSKDRFINRDKRTIELLY